ncbi:MAG: radical SAM protein with 4Fe4S-binding SPASM domain [Paraglaciecola sp.]|jgi:radical SAM protein with 4Fe4S-binding SPASM domain
MKKKQPYCLMPWIHFHVSNNGTAKACCVANIPYGNINEQNLEEIWNGEAINKLRDKFVKGEADKRCAQCIHREAAGGKSIRQETFERFSEVQILNNPIELPIYFDIRFSNVCNFRCRTCWHGASSKWFADAKVLGTNLGEKAILKNINDFNNFIKKTGDALLNAQEIYFAGGEPLATEEHYLLLEWLIENKATNVRLRYNTNFSMLHFKRWKVLEMWAHFPKVEILASIDASEDLGEYIRKEMVWATILDNREKIRALPHLDFQLAPTVSILNIAHLPTLYLESLQSKMIEVDDFYINILEQPFYYNIQAMPLEKKTTVRIIFEKFLNENVLSEKIKGQFEEILAFMEKEDKSKYWAKFLQETGKLDELREEDFKEVVL